MNSEAEGEYVAFATHHANAMWRTSYLICGDRRRAEDATQEALLRLYRRWPKLYRKSGLAGYARKAVVSATLDALRRRSSTELVGGETYFATGADPNDHVGRVEHRIVITQALAELPERQRACVVLRYFEDLSVEETADVLGCRPGTVKSQTLRALEKLRPHPALAGLHLAELGRLT